jgi:hypothetical protein
MRAVEELNYRVTVGDVASQAGLDVRIAEQGLLALASEAGGHLQVAESGEIAYLFPKNFRSILQNKSLKLRLQALWNRVWRVLFYLIRISFGVFLITSIVLILLAITIILIAMSSSRSDDNRGHSSGGGALFIPHFWFGPDLFWIFTPDYYSDRTRYRRRQSRRTGSDSQMNFLEAVFSFLFGDGDPNADLEERRWRAIANVIRNQQGAVIAEQVAPYLDDVGEGYSREYEEYMLPILTRFNGRPEVSPEGQLVYHFPELQVTATEPASSSVMAYLKELPWRFSEASSGQLVLAASLGGVNLVGALVLGSLLRGGTIAAQLGGLVAFVNAIYGVLLGYGIAFLAIPLIRYFWLRGRNGRVEVRNDKRRERAEALNQPDAIVQHKLAYARQFASQTVIDSRDLAYTTETDLTEQELAQADKIDAEWRRRLESGS